MKNISKIIFLLIALSCFQNILASERKEINCFDNTMFFNEGSEVEQLLNSNSLTQGGFIDKIADWIAG
ncbi:MAG: hypothetical protein U9R42_14550 [Bacteroidota bacterium]|nr:hypothetical protein [Bacteroidota bacterium]